MKTNFTHLFLTILLSSSFGYAQMVTSITGSNTHINDAIVLDEDGNLYGSYFSGGNTGAVYKLTPEGDLSIFSEGYSSCNGLDFDNEGQLYVVDFTSSNITHQIYKLDSNGDKTAYGPKLSGASGILFDPNSDTLYVSTYNSSVNAIVKLAPDGTVVTHCDHESLNGPVGLAFDDDANLYVANFTDGEVYKVTYGGDSLELLANVPYTPNWGVGFITYAAGYIYATGIGTHIIYQISLDGEIVEFAGTGSPGTTDGAADIAQFYRPNGITTNDAQDTLYVSDYTTQTIRMITNITTSTTEPTKPVLKTILSQNYPNPANSFTQISYELLKNSFIDLSIYSIKGQLIENLVSSKQTKGKYKITVNLKNYTSGIYLYSLKNEDGIVVEKMMIE